MVRKAIKRLVPVALAVYFVPVLFGCYVGLGLFDVLRNRRRTAATIDRYFAGNGIGTWFLSPLNLFLDLLCLPYRNRGIYTLDQLPPGHREELQTIIDAAHRRDVVGLLASRTGGSKRGMVFFKWYGRNVDAPVAVPEYHEEYRYVRTIGVSVFNTRASTSKHFGPLRATLRVLYNVNDVTDPGAYITVGGHTHRWCDGKLFIFDDTLQHQSCNKTDQPRYCLFLDVVRPSPFPGLLRAVLGGVRRVFAPVNVCFYRQWTFIR